MIYFLFSLKITNECGKFRNYLSEYSLPGYHKTITDVPLKNVIQMVRAAILQVEKDKQVELNDIGKEQAANLGKINKNIKGRDFFE